MIIQSQISELSVVYRMLSGQSKIGVVILVTPIELITTIASHLADNISTIKYAKVTKFN
ncbi:MAG: hypothetical protein AB8W33_12220 [Arsenophonus endosymbiont of Dermacentor nuttalli]